MTEKSYGNFVERKLKEEYGEENVEREVYLAETYRYMDFLVDTGMMSLAIELEHSSEKVVKEGYGQAKLYAKHNWRWSPVIIYPPDGENQEELQIIGQDVTLIPLPHEHE